MILYEETPPRKHTQFELINKFSKVARYKSICKNQLYLCKPAMNNRKKGIMEAIPFRVPSGRIKYLGINLTKDMQDLYSENYKTLLKEIKEDINRWKIFFHIH